MALASLFEGESSFRFNYALTLPVDCANLHRLCVFGGSHPAPFVYEIHGDQVSQV